MEVIDDFRRNDRAPAQTERPFVVGQSSTKVKQAQAAQAEATPAAASPIKPVVPKKRSFAAPERRQSRVVSFLQGAVILILAIALGLGIGSLVIGEIVIGIYAVIALLFHFSSRVSFALALLAFIMIIFLQLFRPDNSLSSNFAVYAFLLLVVGTLSVYAEMRQEARWDKWRRQGSKKKRR